ncbi:hypothetical protein [Amaricoccus sp.]|uniref:hypothetical protein n=1 Tax=Amaricoccus sp. TaxID=1872485 RepID=UPI001B617F0F|nr:hypothetical protein [Amaricoccus sp.]MBP7003013.1 hypothetical protein [Amaricoccus sp.]
MIASFACGFVFIRTRKTASTSTEIALGTWCGPGDVVVPVGIEDEKIRRRHGGGPRNFAADPHPYEGTMARPGRRSGSLH